MKKVQIYRRIKTLFAAFRDMFVEEEPRDKARRTMREATEALNRIVYQRFALEHEYQSGDLDEEASMWCQENLKRLNESERAMSEHLTSLRQQYRTLMLQDIFYKTLNDPGADCYQQAQSAILELQAAVEAERTLRFIPQIAQPSDSVRHLPSAVNETEYASEVVPLVEHSEIIIDHVTIEEKEETNETSPEVFGPVPADRYPDDMSAGGTGADIRPDEITGIRGTNYRSSRPGKRERASHKRLPD